jgi:predicted NACHT family NTPase
MSRRQRGVVLTDRGKQRLEAAIASAQDQEKYGARFTQPELEDRAGLSIKTIKKIRHQEGPADQARVEALFSAFNLALETADYGWPQPDADSTLQPGFDVAAYRRCLQANYGYLKLYTLDSTDRADNIKLWSMFIEQTVREALPPSRYELPLDLKRQLQDEDALGEDLSTEALDYYRREYFQQPARKVLTAVGESQRCVVLGDPGAGKSTLLQYLGLEWVESDAADLPLLIELREYALAESANFLEFLHRGRGVDWQFDPTVLHDYLTQHTTLVMFDGLDEVFDRATQSAIIDDIIRFAQQYPLAKILVTSRIIGYNPERLQHAEFRHFTIQPLDDGEVDEFIERWYDLAMGSDADKVRLKQRLREAIDSSKAIQNLADNPLLLTMMAILNRRQELPRDRADLYDQASRVLLYHWDVDHKRLQLPMDAIGRREKQEILRLVAYEMQAGEDAGLFHSKNGFEGI